MAVTREQISNSKLEQLLSPIAINANKNDIIAVNTEGFESVSFMVLVGLSAGALKGLLRDERVAGIIRK